MLVRLAVDCVAVAGVILPAIDQVDRAYAAFCAISQLYGALKQASRIAPFVTFFWFNSEVSGH